MTVVSVSYMLIRLSLPHFRLKILLYFAHTDEAKI